MGHRAFRGPLQAGFHHRASPHRTRSVQRVRTCRSPELSGPRNQVGRPEFSLRRSGYPAPDPATAQGPTAAQHLLQLGAASLRTPVWLRISRARRGASSARVRH
ncbi:hypothetical protein NDU88_006405 [Pleurodeles waltl]|uniref:Uncharacterized protein n=1 Tax=Pleurodeles waltl TaxID=8319 RepID=A0AAV7X0L0_PLEWA|nr:hypothetical protein NDU88_006405 [Pleurodeles waltl]